MHKFKSICIILIVFSICFFPLSLFAQEEIKGEIININYEYKIAFVDIGSALLSVGDIVEVRIASGEVLSLQVMETTNVLSKLTINASAREDLSIELFDKINVGDAAIKIGKAPLPKTGNSSLSMLDTISQEKGAASENLDCNSTEDLEGMKQKLLRCDQISSDYHKLKEEVREIEKQKQQLKEQAESLTSQVSQKKSQLENMESENRRIKESLNDSYLSIDQLKREKEDQIKEINRFRKIIEQLNDKLLMINKTLRK